MLYDGMPDQSHIVSCRKSSKDVLGEFVKGIIFIQKAVDAQGQKSGDGDSDEFWVHTVVKFKERGLKLQYKIKAVLTFLP